MCLDGEAVPGQGAGGGLQFSQLPGSPGSPGCSGTADGHVTGMMTRWRRRKKRSAMGVKWRMVDLIFEKAGARNEEPCANMMKIAEHAWKLAGWEVAMIGPIDSD